MQKDIEPFEDPVFANNVILTKTERLMMGNRPKQKRAGGGRLRQRQDEILVETQPYTMPQLLRGH